MSLMSLTAVELGRKIKEKEVTVEGGSDGGFRCD